MFKNPLKYQQGGAAITQQDQQMLAAFIAWLPKRVKAFQGMKPEQVSQAVNEMTKSEEGKKKLQMLIQQFQADMSGNSLDQGSAMENSTSSAFKQGGKIHDFICKHVKGGKAGCGCKEDGGTVEKHQQSSKKRVGRGVISEKHTYDNDNGYTGTFSSTGIYGDINGQPAAAPGIYDTLGRYLPKGMTGHPGPFWIVGQGGSNLGGVWYDNGGNGRTQLDSLSAENAARKIMSQGTYNYGVYPKNEKGGKVAKAQPGGETPNVTPQDSSAVKYSEYKFPFGLGPTEKWASFINTDNNEVRVMTNDNNGFLYVPVGGRPKFGTYYSTSIQQPERVSWWKPWFTKIAARQYMPVSNDLNSQAQNLLNR